MLTLSPIQQLGLLNDNQLFIKREDLLPFSFGGNKARKAQYFFKEIDAGCFDAVVTYGSSSSNHCRVISNLCAQRNIPCHIISPLEASEPTFNSKMMMLFSAEITTVAVKDVHDTIENKLLSLKEDGYKPYFIPGGGHGNLGTQAFVDCYDEIAEYEKSNSTCFDYIFTASGTGTTQAGLIAGALLHGDQKQIVGISIARRLDYGKNVILESIRDYFNEIKVPFEEKAIYEKTIFNDEYVGDGYGAESPDVQRIIKNVLINYGIPLDHTYTGKAFYGMVDYLKKNEIKNKNILFMHTGGTPLFFDDFTKASVTGENFK